MSNFLKLQTRYRILLQTTKIAIPSRQILDFYLPFVHAAFRNTIIRGVTRYKTPYPSTSKRTHLPIAIARASDKDED